MMLLSALRTVGLVVLVSLVSCKVVDQNTGETHVNYTTLKLSEGEISGWTQQGVQYTMSSGGYAVCTGLEGLRTLIDGGYEAYTTRGFIEGGVQEFGKADAEPKTAVLWAFDQGSEANATLLFQDKMALATTPITVTGFATTVAAGRSTLGGGLFHAHFHNIYIELTLSGYSVESDVVNAASLFLTTIQSKAE
jgi:hypothetical protein